MKSRINITLENLTSQTHRITYIYNRTYITTRTFEIHYLSFDDSPQCSHYSSYVYLLKRVIRRKRMKKKKKSSRISANQFHVKHHLRWSVKKKNIFVLNHTARDVKTSACKKMGKSKAGGREPGARINTINQMYISNYGGSRVYIMNASRTTSTYAYVHHEGGRGGIAKCVNITIQMLK